MFGTRTPTAAPVREATAPKTRVRRAPTAAEDLQKLIVLQDTVKACYREIGEIKKRNKAATAGKDAPEIPTDLPAYEDDPSFDDPSFGE